IVHYLGYLLPFLNIGIIMANHDKVYGQPYRKKKKAGKEDKGIKDYIRSQLYQGGEQGEEQGGDGDEEVRAHPDLTGLVRRSSVVLALWFVCSVTWWSVYGIYWRELPEWMMIRGNEEGGDEEGW
ncbi:hypothetical protein TrRE_jg3670, partial [Triparma retinervis]